MAFALDEPLQWLWSSSSSGSEGQSRRASEQQQRGHAEHGGQHGVEGQQGGQENPGRNHGPFFNILLVPNEPPWEQQPSAACSTAAQGGHQRHFGVCGLPARNSPGHNPALPLVAVAVQDCAGARLHATWLRSSTGCLGVAPSCPPLHNTVTSSSQTAVFFLFQKHSFVCPYPHCGGIFSFSSLSQDGPSVYICKYPGVCVQLLMCRGSSGWGRE